MAMLDEHFADLTGFDWDAGNTDKSWLKHGVERVEAEQALLNRPVVVVGDPAHSLAELRFRALGRTDSGRELFLVFTIRGSLIRVVSARPMSAGEKGRYAKAKAEADS
ncbi:MAG: BrnT family toxin [Gemmatimonadales bacterium]